MSLHGMCPVYIIVREMLKVLRSDSVLLTIGHLSSAVFNYYVICFVFRNITCIINLCVFLCV